jgi:hypothetical protein
MGLNQFPSRRHLLVATRETRKVADRIKRLYSAKPEVTVNIVTTEPYDVQATLHAIEQDLALSRDKSVVFNLTGGTKPMFAAAFGACARCKGQPFYIDTTNRCIRCLAPAAQPVLPLQPWLNIEAFVALSGFVVKDPGRWDDAPVRGSRMSLTRQIWLESSTFNRLSIKAVPFANRPGQSFSINAGQIAASLDTHGTARISLRGETTEVPDSPDFGRYLAGGWFEEFCYLQLEPLLLSRRITDLRIGLHPDWSSERPTPGGAQDFDLAYTDGFFLFIAECKSGNVKQEDVQKLENNVGKFGGTLSQGLLLSVFPPFGTTERRIAASKALSGFFGTAVSTKLPNMATRLRPGLVHRGSIPGRVGGKGNGR